MSEQNNTPPPAATVDTGVEGIEERYVGYCDILGFSNRIMTDFDGTLKIYKDFAGTFSKMPANEAEVTMYSDAILVTGASLAQVASRFQNLLFIALANDLMVRGAIAKGRYWQRRQDNHMLVASDALVRAVKLERAVGVPAVVFADDIAIPDEVWLHRFANGLFQTPILHFRDRNIVNPFNIFWFRSAEARASRLMESSPAHRDKYLWFLALHEAVGNNQELVPPGVLARFIREGILQLKLNTPNQSAP